MSVKFEIDIDSCISDNASDKHSRDHSSQYGSSFEESSSSVLTSSLSSIGILGENDASERQMPPLEQDNDAPNANTIGDSMYEFREGERLEMSQAISERISLIDSIKWLGHHIPECVVAFLIDSIEAEEANKRPLSDSDAHEILSLSDNQDDNESSKPRENRIGKLCDFDDQSLSQEDLRKWEPGKESKYRQKGRDLNMSNSFIDIIPEYGNDIPTLPSKNFEEQIPHRQARFHNSGYPESQNFGTSKRRSDRRRRLSLDNESESAGYHADFHDSEYFASCNFSEHSNPMEYDKPPFDTKCDLLKHEITEPNRNYSSFRPPQFFDNLNLESRKPRHALLEFKSPQRISSDRSKESLKDHVTRRRVERRSSMPLIVRSMDASDPQSRRGSFRQKIHDYMSDSSSKGSKWPRRYPKPKSDVYFYASDDENRSSLKQDFRMVAQGSFRNLSEELNVQSMQLETLEGEYEIGIENMYFTDKMPPATRHDCALLFVDISGFTKLATTLEVEPLSKTINNYFQMIVEEVEAFGGDVLKFAGDAVFCEWQATTSNPLESGDGYSLSATSQCSIEPWHGLGQRECVLTAATCGARIVDKCSDFPVYDGSTLVATLNVHCGLGYGEVVGVHVGDRETRMEYLILGGPIEQVAAAMQRTRRGEVVASPDALCMLGEIANLDERVLLADLSEPQVIAYKKNMFFTRRDNEQVQSIRPVIQSDLLTKPREKLAQRCDAWGTPALTSLRKKMALYVHPVVVNDESVAKVYPGDKSRAQERHRSEAELREVYTVFIMPLITARLNGDDERDCRVLVLLNDIMLIMTRELSRFKGHLRQFIVDDKGVVLIANFGLRGSTFPNMVAERAIPFTIAVITLLKTELRVECHVGATFDNAYCGVVGGVSRHEYAVLGPSVNLAARLMAHPNNSGFYVDQSVKEKAGSRRFAALPPVKAKGYKDLVQIFEPLPLHDAIRSDLEFRFVGRKAELNKIMEQAKVKTNSRAAHFFLVTGDSGSGKSSLCRQASKQIKMICEESDLTYLSIGIACNEGDVFVPFSITQPLFLEALNFIQNPDAPPQDILESLDGEEISSSLEGNFHQEFSSKTLEYLAGIFEEVHIPDQFKLTIAKLILTRNRADIVECPDNATHCLMLDTLAQYIAEAFLSIIASVDLVLILIDEVVNMDEMSWKIVEKLFCHSQNIFFLGTAKTFEREKVKASENLWSIFLSEDLSMRRFMTVTVEPISLADASNIAQELQDEKLLSCSEASFRTLQLLAQFCDEEMKKQGLSTEDSSNAVVVGVNVANIREMVLQCLDSLQPTLRQYLNLGAILGTSFELMDIVSVFEQHDQVPKEKLRSYASSVHESLEEAVEKGILAFTERESASHVRYNMSDHPYFEKNKIYKFTHDVWRSTILKLTLDEWKKDMHILIAKSMETFIDSKLGNDLRPLTLLFSHWKESGSAREAANLALKIGRQLENRGLNHESLMVYRQSLDMWKVMDNVNEEPNEMIGGLSTSLLSALKSVDIEYLIKLYVALGRCYSNMLEPKESITCFQTALGFILKSPHSLVLHDPMLIFPVVSGLFYTCRFGHDENLEYEEKLVELFEKETKRYSDSMHLSIALAMKAEMFVRNGMLFDAVNSANILRNLYIADQHPNDLTKVYGSDRAGQCIAQSALWNECIGDSERSLCICRYVIDTILPNVDHQDIYNIFQILYPLVWALKRLDNASEAYDIFMKYVVHNADTRLDSRGSTSDKPLHFPIMALLDLATNSRTERFDEYFAWVIDDKNGTFGIKLNCMMGSVGRTADSITAELCLIMTRYVSDSQEKRAFLVNKGYHLAKNVMGITVKCNQSRGMTVPQILEQHIVDQLGIMYNELVPLK